LHRDSFRNKLHRLGAQETTWAARALCGRGSGDTGSARGLHGLEQTTDDFQVAVTRGVSLDQMFRLKEKRTNDWVVRYDNRALQVERQSGRPPARSTVLVYEAIDG
jgi:hypothetical protein